MERILLALTYSVIAADQREEFNKFGQTMPKGHILQSYEWGEVKAATGWEPIRLLVKEDGVAVAAISILKRKLPEVFTAFLRAARPSGGFAK